ncbi:MAG: hypothetical protein PHX21_11080 [bacterium]|nr:hypothetical protein [bacterium]
MKKYFIMLVVLAGFTVNTYAGISFGLKGGYVLGSLKATEVTTKMGSAAAITTTPTGDEAEAKSLQGFGGELFCDITVPILPIGAEIGAGFYSESYDTGSSFSYKVNSMKVSGIGKYYIKGIPMISPWLGVGPFIGFATHSAESKSGSLTVTYTGDMASNFGLTIGTGVKIGILPTKMAINAGILFDYFLTSEGNLKGEFLGIPMESTTKYSQWNLNLMAGISF